MGRPRVKQIDDSAPVTATKKVSKKKTKAADIASPVVKQEINTDQPPTDQKTSQKTKKLEKIDDQENLQEKPKTQKKGKKKFQKEYIRGKKYQNAISQIDREKLYPIDEAIKLACETSFTKFDGAIEVHIVVANLGFRTTITFPHPTGKTRKILVFSSSQPRSDWGQQFIVGTDQTIEDIASSKLQPSRDFQVVIATPEWMPKLAKVAKILGPRGLMPNPKSGTVTTDLDKTLADFAAGQMEIKTEEKAPLVHTIIGRVSSSAADLSDNLKALITALGSNSIRKLVINCTMGPGIKMQVK